MDKRLDALEQQITNLHEYLIQRLDKNTYDSEEPEAKKSKSLPINVREISLEEAQSFYHDCFLPPPLEFDFDEKMLQKWKLESVFFEYKKDASYAIIGQNDSMDKFIDHVGGTLGPQAAKITIRKPCVFSKDGNFYQVLGFCVADKCVLSQIAEFFLYPTISEFLKNDLKTAGIKTNQQIFMEKVLEIEELRCLWADVVAYSLLLSMDLKEGRYVDRKRAKSNMEAFEHVKIEAAKAFVKHMKGG